MVWQGPSGYGSYFGVDGFARCLLPYEVIFEKGRLPSIYRSSGNSVPDSAVSGHYGRFADICRCASDRFIKSCVLVDVADMLKLLGRNLFDEAGIDLQVP